MTCLEIYSDNIIKEAVKESIEWSNSGVLIDGKIREIQKFLQTTPYKPSLSQTEKSIFEEAATRFSRLP